MDGIEVKHCTDEHSERKDDDQTANDAINDLNAVHVELGPYFIYQPRQAVPPQQGAGDDAHIAKSHLQGVMRDNEGKLGKTGDEQKDDQRIGEGHQKSCDGIMP